MSGMFSESAGRLAGLAGAMLGWRPDEFWQSTPAELMTVVRAMAGQSEPALEPVDVERLRAMFPDG